MAEDVGTAVIDASVGLKWALDDERSVDEAVALRDAAIDGELRVVAPSLWAYEVTNGLVMAVRRGRVGRDVGSEALSAILEVGVRMVDPALVDVYDIAVQADLTSYDASYVALAYALRCRCWTADGPLVLASPDDDQIRHISRYLPPNRDDPAG